MDQARHLIPRRMTDTRYLLSGSNNNGRHWHSEMV